MATTDTNASTLQLGEEAMRDLTKLVRAEIALAKSDLRDAATRAKPAMVAFAVAGATGILGAQLALAATTMTAAKHPLSGVVVGVGLMSVAVAAASYGVRLLPTRRVLETKERVARDARLVMEELR